MNPKRIKAQAEKIRRADSLDLPAWLAPADAATLVAIDYRRCKPVGFYAGDEKFAAYFRAVRWLQMVPLRGSRLAEMDTAVLIGLAGGGSGFSNKYADTGRLLQSITRLVGPPDDPSPFDLMDILDTRFPRRFENFDFSKAEQNQPYPMSALMRKLIDEGYYQINSDIRRKTPMSKSLANIIVRVIPAARLPDEILFQQLSDKQLPLDGLAVAAMLGSPFATEKLSDSARKVTVTTRENLWQPDETYKWFRDWKAGLQLYDYYFRTIEALFLPPESGSPEFMLGEFWQAKSCQTALAGWAQLRHTFMLQQKSNENYLGMVMLPPGFVEPNPEFYSRATRMMERTIQILDGEKCFNAFGPTKAAELHDDIVFYEKIQAELKQKNPSKETFTLTLAGTMPLELGMKKDVLSADMEPSISAGLRSEDPEIFFEAFSKFIDALKARATACERGDMRADDFYESSKLRERWDTLLRLTRQLETLAHKQLRRQPWTPCEAQFLRKYGEELAFVMGYFGNSWLTPNDDAPRWAEIARDPQRDTARAIAVGRPRYLYVIYPWNGTEILCLGSVTQYYEYDAGGTPLTDGEWLKRLDSPEAPAVPAWLRAYAHAPGKPLERR